MRLSYDLHMHSALSPCGDNDMTPNNIVNMSLINELDIIAVTDHNSAKNIPAVLEVAKDTGLIVVPGMEVETSEEIHIVCLFPTLDCVMRMDQIVTDSMPGIKNNKDIFGSQLIMNENDDIIGEEERLLVTASGLSIYQVFENTRQLGGVAIPAHIDRNSYSILSNLGFIPSDLPINYVEISKRTEPHHFLLDNNINNRYLASSDAHYLEDINLPINFIEIEDKTISSLFKKFVKYY